MTHLVTGAAGFIGSTLVDRLLADRCRVIGIDCFRDYYPESRKRANIAGAVRHPRFSLLEADLSNCGFDGLDSLAGGEDLTVYHLAAQPGVRNSWGEGFESYLRDNILATQRLLGWIASREAPTSLVFASSSSVYGDSPDIPFEECRSRTAPVSPYGLTKLAAEGLVSLYSASHGFPAAALRFFSVYGPRQRPDMAFHRFLLAVLRGEPVEMLGDGGQTRDFTFVDDVVEGVVRVAASGASGVFNIGGGHRITLCEAIECIERVTGVKAGIVRLPAVRGDARDTLADTARLAAGTGWSPSTTLEDGIRAELAWVRSSYGL